MAPRRGLRAVGEGEAAEPVRKLSITEAAERGTQRELLSAMVDEGARLLQIGCSPRDFASISKRVMDMTREIEALDARAAEDADDGRATPDDAWTAV